MKKTTKKIKKEVYHSDEQIEIMNFVKIIIVLIIFIGGIYLISRIFINKKDDEKNTETTTVEVNYDKAIIGNVFNRPYDEYYAIIYNSTANDASLLSAIISKYSAKEDSIKIYSVDLDNSLNNSYYDKDNQNITTDLNSLKVGDYTLLKIQNHKIVKSFTSIDEIKTELES